MDVKVCVNGEFITLTKDEYIENIPEVSAQTLEDRIAELEEALRLLLEGAVE